MFGSFSLGFNIFVVETGVFDLRLLPWCPTQLGWRIWKVYYFRWCHFSRPHITNSTIKWWVISFSLRWINKRKLSATYSFLLSTSFKRFIMVFCMWFIMHVYVWSTWCSRFLRFFFIEYSLEGFFQELCCVGHDLCTFLWELGTLYSSFLAPDVF